MKLGYTILYVPDVKQAIALAKPKKKPWGQMVSYVRDLNGVIVELCSPVGG